MFNKTKTRPPATKGATKQREGVDRHGSIAKTSKASTPEGGSKIKSIKTVQHKTKTTPPPYKRSY